MSTAPKSRLTPAEYLEIERAAETRSEYFGGEMFAMSGASRAHNTISAQHCTSSIESSSLLIVRVKFIKATCGSR